ncbi:GTPase-associated protein 1-related protein [Longispora sp. NPDC051575]|uniref:GTPase-associated protein 1-related protein n=1 Tax=Longispora sp. NPDC051575 TaxID=3154943 RepID=UPI00341CE422
MDTLVYTDCRPGQGLRGTAGLQFQARSPGADTEAMALVQRALLYEPPPAWMRERRPVADYPTSLAHVSDGILATASGVYLGREANGTREGNQLTHAVVTRDPADYGPVRPAQLFGAPFWRTAPVDGTASPVVEAAPGPLDAETVRDFVRNQSEGVRRLGTLLAALRALGTPGARRVLFVADRPGPVLTWLAAGTLLLPQRVALGIGFKVFTTNPAYAEQPVLAVHPDAGPVPADDYLVFDLVRDVWADGPVDPVARDWAGLFAAGDPYDVTDAVEIAAGSGLAAGAALALGAAAVLGVRPAGEHLPAVVRWLTDGAPELVEAYGAAVVDTVAADVTGWAAAVLRDLDRVTRDGRFPGRAADVRLALLDAEAREAAATGSDRGPGPDPESGAATPEPLDPLTRHEWTPRDDGRAADVLARALAGAHGPAFDAVLRTATRFGLPAPVDRVPADVARFVTHWDQAGDVYDPALWPDGAHLTDLLCDRLLAVLDRAPDRADALGDRWWRRLIGRVVDPASPLDRAVMGAAMAGGSERYRLELLGFDLDKARGDRDAAGAACAALWRRVTPTAAELELVRDRAPVGTRIGPSAVDRHVRAARATPAGLRAAIVLGHALVDRSLVPEPGPDLDGLLADEATLRGVTDGMAAPELRTDDILGRLRSVAVDVVAAHEPELVAAMLDCGRPALVTHLLLDVPTGVRAHYYQELAARVTADGAPPDVLMAALLRGGRPTVLDQALAHWLTRADEPAVSAVAGELADLGDQHRAADWATWAAETRRSRGIRRFLPRRR